MISIYRAEITDIIKVKCSNVLMELQQGSVATRNLNGGFILWSADQDIKGDGMLKIYIEWGWIYTLCYMNLYSVIDTVTPLNTKQHEQVGHHSRHKVRKVWTLAYKQALEWAD